MRKQHSYFPYTNAKMFHVNIASEFKLSAFSLLLSASTSIQFLHFQLSCIVILSAFSGMTLKCSHKNKKQKFISWNMLAFNWKSSAFLWAIYTGGEEGEQKSISTNIPFHSPLILIIVISIVSMRKIQFRQFCAFD